MASGGAASTVATMLVFDGTAQITHPAADGPPNLPTLNAPADASRTNNSTPLLSANYTDPESDSGTLSFQLCSDAACSSVLQSNTTSSIASGANGTWTPTALLSGTYYWRAQATDATSNVSGWSATRSFVVDLIAPGAPTLNSPAVGSTCHEPGVERNVRGLRSDRQRDARLPALLGSVMRERPPEHDVGDGRRRHRNRLDAGGARQRDDVLLACPGNRRGRESDGVDGGPELRLRHEPAGRSHSHESGERRVGHLDRRRSKRRSRATEMSATPGRSRSASRPTARARLSSPPDRAQALSPMARPGRGRPPRFPSARTTGARRRRMRRATPPLGRARLSSPRPPRRRPRPPPRARAADPTRRRPPSLRPSTRPRPTPRRHCRRPALQFSGRFGLPRCSRHPTPVRAAPSNSRSAPTRRARPLLRAGRPASHPALPAPGRRRRASVTTRSSGVSAQSISPATRRPGRSRVV